MWDCTHAKQVLSTELHPCATSLSFYTKWAHTMPWVWYPELKKKRLKDKSHSGRKIFPPHIIKDISLTM
jgi:hypothetical protein